MATFLGLCPNDYKLQVDFLRMLDSVRAWWYGAWLMGGDWNVLKYSLDRLGGCCISSDMRDFSKRINSNSILDLRPFFFWVVVFDLITKKPP